MWRHRATSLTPQASPRRPVPLSDAALIAAIVGIVSTRLLWGEKIEVSDGLGWDGEAYALIADKFDTLIATKAINAYSIQRIVPSAIVHYSLRSLSAPRTTSNIIIAFGF